MDKDFFYNLLAEPGELGDDTLPGLKELTEKYPFFQAAWLLYLKNLKITNHPQFGETLKKVAVMVPDRKQMYRYLNDSDSRTFFHPYLEQSLAKEPLYRLEDDENKESGNSLIDKFLQAKPAPLRMDNHTDETNSSGAANEILERSNAEDDELITETLAMIYFEQKKYEKALDAFQKLSLKYPEKSIYFATRIEEIENLKNL